MDPELATRLTNGLKQGLLYVYGDVVHEQFVRRVTGLAGITSELKRDQVPLILDAQITRLALSPLWCDADAALLRQAGYSEPSVAMAQQQALEGEAMRLKMRGQYARDHPGLGDAALDQLFARRATYLVHIHHTPDPMRMALGVENGDVAVLGVELPPMSTTSLDAVEACAEAYGKALCEGATANERSGIYFDFVLVSQQRLHLVLCVKTRQ